MPFLENRANLAAIARHPAPKVLVGDFEQAAIAVEAGRNLAILRRIAPVNQCMRKLSLHGGESYSVAAHLTSP